MFNIDNLNDLKGKKVLTVGFSVTGRAALNFFLRSSADCYLIDSSEMKLEDTPEVEEFKNKGVKFNFGFQAGTSLCEDFIKDSNFAILSPSIPESSEVVNKLKKLNIPFMSDLELAFKLKPKNTKMIVITGTNGKTTTTMLVSHMLSSKYFAPYVGNVGVSPLDYLNTTDAAKVVGCLNDAKEPDFLVCEASSYQLHYSETLAPEYAVLCNVTPDHISWHGGFENYLKDKSDIFLRMGKESHSILNFDDKNVRKLGEKLKANLHYFKLNHNGANNDCYIKDSKIYYGDIEIMHTEEVPILGPHNLQNVMCAIVIGLFSGLNKDEIKNAIMSFKAPPHRCEFIDKIGKTSYFNDSKATNPEASIVAINSFAGKKVSLIAGGRDKNTSLDEFVSCIKEKMDRVILIGEAADRFEDALLASGFKDILRCDTLEEAIDEASKVEPDAVLFSPACASFDMFKNYETRGEAFRDYVLSKKHRLS